MAKSHDAKRSTSHTSACCYVSHDAGFPVTAMYSFGTPRVGNPPWAAAYQAAMTNASSVASFRVVHNQDDVPHLPPQVCSLTHTCIEPGTDNCVVCVRRHLVFVTLPAKFGTRSTSTTTLSGA